MAQVDQKILDAFNNAYSKNKKEREERENKYKGIGTWEIERFEWCGLEDNVEKVVRILGSPYENRQKGTDTKLVYHSKFINDKKEGYVNIVWKLNKDNTLDTDWVLYELYAHAMKKEWKKYADGHKNEKGYDGEYKFIYEDTETFKRLNINKKKSGSNMYPPQVKPKARILMNVIDRHDNWCKENKHSKVLTSKIGYWRDDENGNPIIFPDLGVPEIVYNRIMDEVVAYRHHWFLDIVIKKNSKDLSNAYIVKDILDEKIRPESKKIGTDAPLTEEELAYELYDFDKSRLTTTTPYYKLHKSLIGLFKMADAEFNTHFTEKLEQEVEREMKTMSVEEQKIIDEEFEKEKELDDFDQKQERETITIQKLEQSTRSRRESVEIDFNEKFPYWNKLNATEQSEMKKAVKEFNGNIPVYVNPNDVLPCVDMNCTYPGTKEQTKFPSTVFTCPVCGMEDKS